MYLLVILVALLWIFLQLKFLGFCLWLFLYLFWSVVSLFVLYCINTRIRGFFEDICNICLHTHAHTHTHTAIDTWISRTVMLLKMCIIVVYGDNQLRSITIAGDCLLFLFLFVSLPLSFDQFFFFLMNSWNCFAVALFHMPLKCIAHNQGNCKSFLN